MEEGTLRHEDISMIRKIKGKYVVLSETTGRSFGSYRTKTEAERRLRQIEFFKHLKSRQGNLVRRHKKKARAFKRPQAAFKKIS